MTAIKRSYKGINKSKIRKNREKGQDEQGIKAYKNSIKIFSSRQKGNLFESNKYAIKKKMRSKTDDEDN